MKALYHTEGNPPLELTVLKKNKDGTVDIGPEGGVAVVTNCPLVAEAANGSASLIDESKPEEIKPDESKKSK